MAPRGCKSVVLVQMRELVKPFFMIFLVMVFGRSKFCIYVWSLGFDIGEDVCF